MLHVAINNHLLIRRKKDFLRCSWRYVYLFGLPLVAIRESILLKHADQLEQRIVDDPQVLAKATHTSFVYSTY